MLQPTKDPAGLIIVEFDFGDQTPATPSAAVTTAIPYQGDDTTPLSPASPTISGTVVSQPITGGTPGMIYNLRCAATYDDGVRIAGKVLTVTFDPPGYSPSVPTYTVGGTLLGLSGTIVLENNDVDDLTQSINGSFTFPSLVPSGSVYSVDVKTQPTDQYCTVTNGSGTVIAPVSNIIVQCVTAPGVNWTSRTSISGTWASICYSPELTLFCVVGNTKVMTSPDGANWTSRTPSASTAWNAVCWSPGLGLFAAVSTSGSNAMTSPDGINWTSRTLGSAVWTSICWSPELSLFVAVGTGSFAHSSNGIAWNTGSVTGSWNSVCWSPELGLFCAVSQSGNLIMTSGDGINWATHTAPETNAWKSVCWSPSLGIFCAVAFNGTHRVMTSINGVNWVAQTAAEADVWNSICWSPEIGIFVAVASTGTNEVMTSYDGVNWTSRFAAASESWISVAWAGNLLTFAAVASGGQAMTSP